MLGSGFRAELVEGADQFAGDLLGGGLLDDETLHEVDQLAVAQESDGGGGGRIAVEVAAGALGGFAVLAGEDGDFVVGKVGGVGERKAHAGAHLARRASADGVDNQQSCARLGQRRVNVFGGTGFLEPARANSSRIGMTISSGYMFASGKGSCLSSILMETRLV